MPATHDHRHCAGYARANRGLPAVEPGMPTPAGTGLSRRSFLLRSAGMALSVYGASALVPELVEESVAQASAGGPQTVLVSIFLSGGIDGLSVLAPHEDAKYQALRSTLKVTGGTALREDPRLVWHPAAQGLADLHAQDKVVVMPAMGYTSPNQSHFTSRHFWQVGSLDVHARTGWMGRWLDRVGDPNNAIQGLSLQSELSPSIATSRVAVAAASSPTEYKFDSPGVWGDDRGRAPLLASFGRLGTLETDDPVLAQARQAHANAAILREQLADVGPPDTTIAYPDDTYGRRLRALAQMLGVGLPIRCATLDAVGGYDTHSDQSGSFARNLKGTVDGIVAFQRDLEARGLADRVLVHLWSEFGRRPEENGSAGTDHGAAGVGFLIGSRVKPGMLGEFPGLQSLDQHGNLKATSDFRGLYCSLVDGWLGGAEAADVIPDAAKLPRYAILQ